MQVTIGRKSYLIQTIVLFGVIGIQSSKEVIFLYIMFICYNAFTFYHMKKGGARWLSGKSVGLRIERSGVRNLSPPCCVLEQDTLLPESTG